MGLSINDKNYDKYKKIFEIFCSHKDRIFNSSQGGILSAYETLLVWELKNKSLAKRGLKESLRDIISSLKNYPPEMTNAINEELESNNLPNISMLRSIINDTIEKVLKRERINNYDEYYIIKEIIVDRMSDMNEKDKTLLNSYLFDFEFSKIK
jgi:hypothetical protein